MHHKVVSDSVHIPLHETNLKTNIFVCIKNINRADKQKSRMKTYYFEFISRISLIIIEKM